MQQSFLADAHEQDVRNGINRLSLRLGVLIRQRLKHHVRLQFAEDLVIAEVRVFGKIEDSHAADLLIVFIVEHLHNALSNEEHFLDVALVADHSLVLLEDATEHVNDEFVGEAALTLVEEMIERPFKLLEYSSVLNQVCLHFRRDLLIEVELLNDKVEIVKESLLDVFPDVVVQRRLDMERLVGLLNFLNPHV